MERDWDSPSRGEKGDHSFRSTLIQTLIYDMFPTWLLWRKRSAAPNSIGFNWRAAAYELKVPMVQALFHQLIDPTKLQPLGLEQVLDWSASVLDRVDFAQFSSNFESGQAVQYLYGPFLEAFDPELRKSLGVWPSCHYCADMVCQLVRRHISIEVLLPRARVGEGRPITPLVS